MKPAESTASAWNICGIICLAFIFTVGAAAAQTQAAPQLVIRTDDVGMCHDANLAVEKLIPTGIPFSASVMIPSDSVKHARSDG